MELNGYPRGWFAVCFSNEIEAGGVKPLKYFGKDLVLYRTEDGTPVIHDAICPHLGAHLGVGGTVDGCTIRCPFHAWRFDESGACVDVPYAKRIPKKAAVKTWPVRERNGCVWVWHSHSGDEPDWEIPSVPAPEDGLEWLPWHQSCLQVKTHPREIVENVADIAHFPVVHRTEVDTFENIYEGHMATQLTAGKAYPAGGGVDDFKIRATYFGPGCQVSWMEGVLQSRLLLAHTPIDHNTLDLRFAVKLQDFGDAERGAKFAQGYADNLRIGFHEDISIWVNKKWRDQPLMCDGDGPLGRLRVWYRQFYA